MSDTLRDRLAEALYVDGHHHPNLVDDLLLVVQAAIAEAHADERRNTAEHIARMIDDAAAMGSRLLVSPEAAFLLAARIARDEAGGE